LIVVALIVVALIVVALIVVALVGGVALVRAGPSIRTDARRRGWRNCCSHTDPDRPWCGR
jgi:hypothetical protein